MLLQRLRADQFAIAKHPAKVKILAAGRRWGKTTLGGTLVSLVVAKGGRAAWIAPTYKNTRPLWRWLHSVFSEEITAGLVHIHESDRVLRARNGGMAIVYSGDNIDAVRGEAFNLVVLDEAARLSEHAWQEAIRPTLADANGDALLISTPAGRNWFYVEYMRSSELLETEQKSWHAPSHANPIRSIRDAAELAKVR